MRLPAAASTSTPPRRWRDAREWLEHVRDIGELREVRGVDWWDGIAATTALLDRTDGAPAVLFDQVPGYESGRRVLVNCNGTLARQAVTLGLAAEEATHDGVRNFWRAVLAAGVRLPPVEVETGPVFENVLEGEAVDLEAFPVPIWHPQDGGRYIGTASLNILKDPETSWVNVGTYRNQIFSRNELGMWISPGKHGRLIRDRSGRTGERIPVVVVVGADPLLFLAAAAAIPFGTDEFAWAGGVRGEAVEIVRGPRTGLPFPAAAEIAIEGWIDPDRWHDEGPYGEFHGYYGYGEGRTPVIEVEAIYHRSDPILLGCPQGKPPHEDNRALAYLRAAQVEAELAAAGVPPDHGGVVSAGSGRAVPDRHRARSSLPGACNTGDDRHGPDGGGRVHRKSRRRG